MPSLTRRRDRDAAANVARQRLARLAEAIAAGQPDRGGADASGTEPTGPSPAPTTGAAPAGSARHRADPLPSRRRVGAAVGDRLPAGAQRLRAERGVSGQHVTVVALVVAALIAVGAWWVVAGRPGQSVAVAPVTSGAVEPTTAVAGAVDAPAETGAAPDTGPTAIGTTAAGEEVVVDVTGKVRRPGLVTLPTGSRVADALDAAGGVRPGVDVTALNLARPLVDGEQILVGVEAAPWPAQPTAPGTTVPGAAPVAPVDVNTATLEQLDTLPGIGPVTGQAILDWRIANGAFTTVDELLEVDGIGDATLADIRDLVTV